MKACSGFLELGEDLLDIGLDIEIAGRLASDPLAHFVRQRLRVGLASGGNRGLDDSPQGFFVELFSHGDLLFVTW